MTTETIVRRLARRYGARLRWAVVGVLLVAGACAAREGHEADAEMDADADAVGDVAADRDAGPDAGCGDRVAAFDAIYAALCARQRACAFNTDYELRSSSGGPITRWCEEGSFWAQQRERLAACQAHIDPVAASACIDGLAALSTCVLETEDPLAWLYPPPEHAPFGAAHIACERAYVDDRLPCGSGAGRFRGECCSASDGACAPWNTCVDGRCTDEVCAPNVCHARGHPRECVDGACADRAELGAPCRTGELRCTADAYCTLDEQTCAPRAAAVPLGGACASDADCGVEARCGVGVCRASPSCDGSAADCEPGRFCMPEGGAFTHECSPEPRGSFCRYGWLGTVWVDTCPDGFQCIMPPGLGYSVCGEAVGEGEPCDTSHVCTIGLGCSVGRCVALSWEMDPCDDDGACAAPLVCLGGVCGAAAP